MATKVGQLSEVQYMLAASAGDDGEKRVAILLVPEGNIEVKGREFTLDEKHFAMIAEKFNKLGRPMVVDYEHQTLGGKYASPDGKAPAAGWVHELRYEKGRGIVGMVEWTAKARQFIKDGEYRYLSPVLMVRLGKSGAFPIELSNAAITNDPAIPGMERIAATRKKETRMKDKKKDKRSLLDEIKWAFQEATPEEQAAVTEDVVEQVDEVGVALANLKSALGMADGSTPVQIINAAIEALSGDDEEEGGEMDEEAAASRKAFSTIRQALSLADDAGVEDITGAIDTMIAGNVSAESYKKVAERLEVLEAERREANAKSIVNRFVESGQLNPQDEVKMKWAFDRANKDASAFCELMEGAPTVIPTGKVGDADKNKGERDRLIALSGSSYEDAARQFPGLEKAAFINEALRDSGLDLLTTAERTKLGEEV